MRVVVTGAGGQVGRELARALASHEATMLDRAALDVTDAAAVEGVLRAASPDAIIHAAAWTDVDACERDPARAEHVNVAGTANVAAAAGEALLVLISTDFVFDGMLGRAYTEDDQPNPVQVYGRTKLSAELAVMGASRWAIARTAWVYGARRADGSRARTFVSAILDALAEGPVDVVDDQTGSPTCAPDLADGLVSLLERGATGLFHVVNAGAASRFELARAIAPLAGFDPDMVRPATTASMPPRPARRPTYAPLEPAAWRAAGFEALAPWEDALARTIGDLLGGR